MPKNVCDQNLIMDIFNNGFFLREITFCPKYHPEYVVNQEAHYEINIFIHEDVQFHKCTFQKYHSEMMWIELTTFNQLLFSILSTK